MKSFPSPAKFGRRARLALLGVLIATGSMLGGCDRVKAIFADQAAALNFAPYDKAYASKPDFARLEYKYPLPRSQRARLAPDDFATFDQEQIDQIYARLTAGPIPDGAYDGKIVFPRGTSGKLRIAEIAGGFTGLALRLKGLEIESLGETMWKGKVFYRDERVLRNRIEDLDALKKIGVVEGEPRKLAFRGKEAWLLFPAKLYCGQSLLDARRESIVIDYFFADEIDGYQEKPDFLAGRRGLRVRDEIRMVRPGFYVGRAYIDRVFLLNFTLYNEDIAKRDANVDEPFSSMPEDCYAGTQQQSTAAAK